jgi:hypothetical protein
MRSRLSFTSSIERRYAHRGDAVLNFEVSVGMVALELEGSGWCGSCGSGHGSMLR